MRGDRREMLLAGLAAGAAAMSLAAPQAKGSERLAAARSVTEFGIAPNIADDQAEPLQRALAQTAAEGVPLWFPQGAYITGQTLRMLPTARLAGAPGSVIKSTQKGAVLAASGIEDAVIDGLSFAGRSSGSALILLEGDGRVALTHCHIGESAGGGVVLNGVTARVHACSFQNVSGTAVACSNNAALWLTENVIEGCGAGFEVRSALHAHIIGNKVIRTRETAVLIYDAANAALVLGNIIETAGRGIVIRAGMGTAVRYAVQANAVRDARIGIGAELDQSAFGMISLNMISGAPDGAIRALAGTLPTGPDLAHESAEAFRNLAVVANVAL